MARLPPYVIPGQPQHVRKWCLTPFFFLGFGERARVDGPAFLRREFAGRMAAAAKLYK